MPKCKKCNNAFPMFVVIDGKERNLQNRKYCLNCSPFGSHNTKTIEKTCDNDIPCVCTVCGKEYIRRAHGGGTLKKCSSCWTRESRKRLKQKAIDYLGGKCSVCGYDRCLRALQFHHVNPAEKDFPICGSTRSWGKIKNELDKCILVCGNCHSEIHDGIDDADLFREKIQECFRERSPTRKLNVCAECGNKTHNDKYCSRKCLAVGQRKTVRASAAQLRQDIKSMSYVAVGKKYGVSDNTIRKWARGYKII